MLRDAHPRVLDHDQRMVIKAQLNKLGINPTEDQVAMIKKFINDYVKIRVLLLDVDNTLINLHEKFYPFQGSLKNFDVLIPVLRFAQAMGVELGIATSRGEALDLSCTTNGLVTVADMCVYLQSNGVTINPNLVFMRDTLSSERHSLTSEINANLKQNEKIDYHAEGEGAADKREQPKQELKERHLGKNLELFTALERLGLSTVRDDRCLAGILDDEPRQVDTAVTIRFTGVAVTAIDPTGNNRHITDITYITGDKVFSDITGDELKGSKEIMGLADLVGLNQFIKVCNDYGDDISQKNLHFPQALMGISSAYSRAVNERKTLHKEKRLPEERYVHSDLQTLFPDLASGSDLGRLRALQALTLLSHLRDFDALLEKNHSHEHGMTILGQILVGQFKRGGNEQLIRVLVEANGQFKANPSKAFRLGDFEYTPLQYALINELSSEVIGALINAGARFEGKINGQDVFDYALNKALTTYNVELLKLISDAINKEDDKLRDSLMAKLRDSLEANLKRTETRGVRFVNRTTTSPFTDILDQHNAELLHAVLGPLQDENRKALMDVDCIKNKINAIVSSHRQDIFTRTVYMYFARLVDRKAEVEFYSRAVVAPKTGGSGRPKSSSRSRSRSNKRSAGKQKLAVALGGPDAAAASKEGSVSSSMDVSIMTDVKDIRTSKEVLRQYLIHLADYIKHNKNRRPTTGRSKRHVDTNSADYYHGFVDEFKSLFAYYESVRSWLESLDRANSPTADQFDMIIANFEALLEAIQRNDSLPVLPLPNELRRKFLDPLRDRGKAIPKEPQQNRAAESDGLSANSASDLMNALKGSLESVDHKEHEEYEQWKAEKNKFRLARQEIEKSFSAERSPLPSAMSSSYSGVSATAATSQTTSTESGSGSANDLQPRNEGKGKEKEQEKEIVYEAENLDDDEGSYSGGSVIVHTEVNKEDTVDPETALAWEQALEGQRGKYIVENTRHRHQRRSLPRTKSFWTGGKKPDQDSSTRTSGNPVPPLRSDVELSATESTQQSSAGRLMPGGHRNSMLNQSQTGGAETGGQPNWARLRHTAPAAPVSPRDDIHPDDPSKNTDVPSIKGGPKGS